MSGVVQSHNLPQSMTMIRIGGEDYPQISDPRCLVCQSPHRLFIENEILRGRGYTAINRQVRAMDPDALSEHGNRSIAHHVTQRHLTAPAQARKDIIDHRAKQIGLDIMGEGNATDHVTVLQMIVHRGKEQMDMDKLNVSTSDLLRAIQMLDEIEKTSPEGFDAEAQEQAYMVYFEEARERMTPDAFADFCAAIDRSPILAALNKKASGEGQVISGEVVNDY